jgi:hypothetical protein
LENVTTEGFQSQIEFKSDLTYTISTNGVVKNGKYELKKNKLIFLEEQENGQFEHAWMLRWPKSSTDPFPRTKEIDINYPHLFELKKPGNGSSKIELDVYYKKG